MNQPGEIKIGYIVILCDQHSKFPYVHIFQFLDHEGGGTYSFNHLGSVGNGKIEGGSVSEFTLHPDSPLEHVYIGFCDGQPQTGTFEISGKRFTRLTKPFKDDFLLVETNPHTRILHIKFKHIPFFHVPQFNGSLVCEFEGIFNKIGKDGINFLPVGMHGGLLVLQPCFIQKFDPPALCFRFEKGMNVTDLIVDIGIGLYNLSLPCFYF